MKKLGIMVVLLLTLVSTLAAGGSSDSQEPSSEQLRVVATTSIVGDVVAQVFGDNGQLTVLMPVGQNPHSFTASPQDVVALEEADVIFVNGLDLEEELMPMIESIEGAVVVEVSHGVDLREGGHDHDDDEHDHDDDEHDHDDDEHEHHDDDDHDHDHDEDEHHDDDEHDHDHSAGDPHTWFSPLNVIQWVAEIEEALIDADPENADSYSAAAAAYGAELEALDEEVRELVATIDPADRQLVLDHAALGYFAGDYGFKVLTNLIPSISDQAEPSPQHIAEVVEIINEYQVKAIFVGGTAAQSLVRVAEAVSDEIGREVPVVSILTGSLTASGRGADYIDFIRYNTEQIVEVLSQ